MANQNISVSFTAEVEKKVLETFKQLETAIKGIESAISRLDQVAGSAKKAQQLSDQIKGVGNAAKKTADDVSALQRVLNKYAEDGNNMAVAIQRLYAQMGGTGAAALSNAEREAIKYKRAIDQTAVTLKDAGAGGEKWRQSVDVLAVRQAELAGQVKLTAAGIRVLNEDGAKSLGLNDRMVSALSKMYRSHTVYNTALEESKKRSQDYRNQFDALAKTFGTLDYQVKQWLPSLSKAHSALDMFKSRAKDVQGIKFPNLGAVMTGLEKGDFVASGTSGLKVRTEEGLKLLGVNKQIAESAGLLARNFREATPEVGFLQRAFGNLGETMANTLKYFVTGSAIMTFIASIRFGTQTIIEFDQALKDLQAITGATAEETDAMGKKIIEVATKTSYSTKEVAEAMKVLGQAGLSAAQATQTMEAAARLAQGTLSDMKMVADLMTTSMVAFNIQASDSARIADVMATAVNRSKLDVDKLRTAFNYVAPAAGMMGLSLEETASATMILANAGLRASTIGTSFRQVLERLVDPSDKVRETLKAMGADMTKLNPELSSMETVITELTRVITSTDKAFAVFGSRGASAVAALVNAGTDGFNQMLAEVNKVGAAEKMTATQAQGLGFMLKNLVSNIEAAIVAFGDAGFGAALKGIISSLTFMFKALTTFLESPFAKFLIMGALATTMAGGLTKAMLMLSPAIEKAGLAMIGFLEKSSLLKASGIAGALSGGGAALPAGAAVGLAGSSGAAIAGAGSAMAPFVLILPAIMALATLIPMFNTHATAAINNVARLREQFDKETSSVNANYNVMNSSIKILESSKTSATSKIAVLQDLAKAYPQLGIEIDSVTGKILDEKTAFVDAIPKLKEFRDALAGDRAASPFKNLQLATQEMKALEKFYREGLEARAKQQAAMKNANNEGDVAFGGVSISDSELEARQKRYLDAVQKVRDAAGTLQKMSREDAVAVFMRNGMSEEDAQRVTSFWDGFSTSVVDNVLKAQAVFPEFKDQLRELAAQLAPDKETYLGKVADDARAASEQIENLNTLASRKRADERESSEQVLNAEVQIAKAQAEGNKQAERMWQSRLSNIKHEKEYRDNTAKLESDTVSKLSRLLSSPGSNDNPSSLLSAGQLVELARTRLASGNIPGKNKLEVESVIAEYGAQQEHNAYIRDAGIQKEAYAARAGANTDNKEMNDTLLKLAKLHEEYATLMNDVEELKQANTELINQEFDSRIAEFKRKGTWSDDMAGKMEEMRRRKILDTNLKIDNDHEELMNNLRMSEAQAYDDMDAIHMAEHNNLMNMKSEELRKAGTNALQIEQIEATFAAKKKALDFKQAKERIALEEQIIQNGITPRRTLLEATYKDHYQKTEELAKLDAEEAENAMKAKQKVFQEASNIYKADTKEYQAALNEKLNAEQRFAAAKDALEIAMYARAQENRERDYRLGKISTEQYMALIDNAYKHGQISEQEMKRKKAENGSIGDMISYGFEEAKANTQTFGQFLVDMTSRMGETIADNLTQGIFDFIDGTKGAEEAFADFARNTIRWMSEMMMKQALMGMLFGTAGSTGGGIFGLAKSGVSALFGATVAHTGGVVGNIDTFRTVGVNFFDSSIPRFHGGGVVGNKGLNAREVPAILKDGETVLTEEQSAAIGKGLSSTTPVFNVSFGDINISMPGGGSGDAAKDRESATALGKAVERALESKFAEMITRFSKPGGPLNPRG